MQFELKLMIDFFLFCHKKYKNFEKNRHLTFLKLYLLVWKNSLFIFSVNFLNPYCEYLNQLLIDAVHRTNHNNVKKKDMKQQNKPRIYEGMNGTDNCYTISRSIDTFVVCTSNLLLSVTSLSNETSTRH